MRYIYYSINNNNPNKCRKIVITYDDMTQYIPRLFYFE